MPIELKNISYIYGAKTPFEKKVFENLSLTIEDNTITGLIGHTGSGKSTIAQLLNGLYKPESGEVIVDGINIHSSKKTLHEAKFNVGLVFQYPEYQLFEETVFDDIAYGPKNMGLDEAEIIKRVKEAADFAGLSEKMLKMSPFELSGGQKRRAAIAGIVAMKPKYLVLDEPAAGLDPMGRDSILKKISEYKKAFDSSVLIISHSMEDMAKYCDKIIVLKSGEVFNYGTPEQIFSSPEKLAKVGLNVPQITKLMYALKNHGIEFDRSFYTVSDAVEALVERYKNGGSPT